MNVTEARTPGKLLVLLAGSTNRSAVLPSVASMTMPLTVARDMTLTVNIPSGLPDTGEESTIGFTVRQPSLARL